MCRVQALTITVLSALASAACSEPRPTSEVVLPASSQPLVPDTLPMPTATATTVVARLTVERVGDGLDGTATIENGTASPIWVLDAFVDADRPVVSRGEPGTVRVVLGFLGAESQMPQVEQGVSHERVPSATLLAPRASRSRTIHLSMPLVPWHPYLGMATLPAPRQLVLEVGYLTEDPGAVGPTLATVKTRQRWVRSALVPLAPYASASASPPGASDAD